MPLEQAGVDITVKAFFIETKVGKTGLTVTVDVYNPAGTQVVTDGAATEVGGGLYTYTIAGSSLPTTEGEWVAVFKTATTTVDVQHIPTIWVVGRTAADVANVEVDTQDIQGRLPTALISGRMSSDAVAISGSTSAADTVEANIGNLDEAISNVAQPGDEMNIVDGGLSDAKFAADMDTYSAYIWMVDDGDASTDRYMVLWFKNGVPVTSGITSPTIQVVRTSDGADLVASSAMTQIGSTGAYRYDEATNRIADGAGYFVHVAATIDSGSRTFRQPMSRDST